MNNFVDTITNIMMNLGVIALLMLTVFGLFIVFICILDTFADVVRAVKDYLIENKRKCRKPMKKPAKKKEKE